MAIYVDSTTLLLHGDGVDGSTVFTDETGKAVTAYGNAKISTAQSKFGGASMYFDGVGDYLRFGISTDFEFPGDFSVEAWVYCGSHLGNIFSCRDVSTNGITVRVYQGKLSIFYAAGAGDITVNADHPINQWFHLALVRFGATVKVYQDGAEVGSALTWNGILLNAGSSSPCVGAYLYPTPGEFFSGYIDDLRITKGLALYTANFTPPSAPLGLINPVQVSIQSQNPGLHKLAKFDPSQSKPATKSRADDLQNRMPYGPWKTPNVVWEFVGRGIVTGTVAEKSTPANTPLHRLVRLHREPDGLLSRPPGVTR
jgi:hypothetical protein